MDTNTLIRNFTDRNGMVRGFRMAYAQVVGGRYPREHFEDNLAFVTRQECIDHAITRAKVILERYEVKDRGLADLTAFIKSRPWYDETKFR